MTTTPSCAAVCGDTGPDIRGPDCGRCKAANAACSTTGDLAGDGGVLKSIIQQGIEAQLKPTEGDYVRAHCKGTLSDGTEFENTYATDTPLAFTVGAGETIRAYDTLAQSMARGERARATVRPDYGFGDAGGAGGLAKVPGNETLTVEMHLLAWEKDRDLFRDGTVVKSEIFAGEGTETPGERAEVCVDITAHEMTGDGEVEGKKLHAGVSTCTLAKGQMAEIYEKVLPNMKKNAEVHLVCRPPRTSGPGLDYVPPDAECVRFAVKLLSWCKIESVSEDGAIMKKIVKEGEGFLRPPMGSFAVITVKYFLPDPSSDLDVPPALSDVLHTEEEVQLRVGYGAVVDGIDQAVQSMRLGEEAMVSLAAPQAFETAPKLLPEALSAAQVSPTSAILVEVTLRKFEKPKDVRKMSGEERVAELQLRKARGNELFKAGRPVAAHRVYQHAADLFEAGKADVASGLRAQVSELLCSCHLNMAACLSRTGDLHGVLAECRVVLDSQSANVKALYRQGCAHVGLEDFENASASLRQALALDPGNTAVAGKLCELKARQAKQDAKDRKAFSGMFG